jgi:apolipoprotein N-acyltransferase
MKRSLLYFLALLSGLLLSLAWSQWVTGLILMIAFLPLLIAEDYLDANKSHYSTLSIIPFSFFSFTVWNLLTTWWIGQVSVLGMLAAVLFTSSLMTFVFLAFHFSKRLLGRGFGYFSLLVFWLTFEYYSLHSELSWPWLNLGNGLAKDTAFIQWYEYTGVTGGSLWILLVNLAVYDVFRHYRLQSPTRDIMTRSLLALVIIGFPMIASLTRFKNYEEKQDPHQIIVLQPNIDSHKKFSEIPSEMQTHLLVHLADSLITPATEFVLAPETAIISRVSLDNPLANESVQTIKEFVAAHPQINFILGATVYQQFKDGEDLPPEARKMSDTGSYFVTYNAALMIDSTKKIRVYFKNKLVAGVERIPYPKVFGFMKKLMIRLGDQTGSYGIRENKGIFNGNDRSPATAPVICYESAYGEYISGYISKGAGYIFIITNDGWWKNQAGSLQHNRLASLRAIETRRSIARSANTGISSFINQKGQVIKQLERNKRGAIRTTLNANSSLTFYVTHGDFLSRIARFFAFLTILYVISNLLMKKDKYGVR